LRILAGPALALSYHVVSRLAYVVGVGTALRHEERAPHADVDAAFRRFRRLASILMVNDALSFGLLCVLARDSLPGRGVLAVLGLALICCGAGTKVWAARTLGGDAYYWRDFFEPHRFATPNRLGPYRFLKNPMYTLGYAHVYGFALLCGSGVGLVAAAFDQAAILVFYRLVEHPHLARLAARAGVDTGSRAEAVTRARTRGPSGTPQSTPRV
jgi:protein-S-isoprenylcysteine O-methyltransferase Ste14